MSAAADVARVAQRCEDAKESQRLDLSWCMLDSFPDAVFFLLKDTTLVKCDLCNNQLKRLNRKFCTKFYRLVGLNLANNQMESLPVNIDELEQLTALDVSMNKITTLPPSLFNLQRLEVLDLSDNDITDLDVTQLCNMASLKKVCLSNNPLAEEVIQQLQASARFEIVLPDTSMTDFSDVD